jgi:hypothetical protein
MDMEHPKQLHIRGEEAHRLAKELAQRTGDTIAGAVTKAIRSQLEAIHGKRARDQGERRDIGR